MFEDEPKKPSVKLLTLIPPTRPSGEKAVEHAEMEDLAVEVAFQFRGYSRGLRNLQPKIQRIQDYFANSVRGSVRLAGCSSFKEYCEKKLGRTRQAVYAMLGDYPKKQKEKKKWQPKGKHVYEGDLTQVDVTRMQTGLNAIYRFELAKEKGDEEEARSAWQEYQRIAAAEPIRSAIGGDQPNYKVLLLDVLAAAKQIEAGALQIHEVVTRIVESGMLADDPTLLASVRSTMSSAEELLGAGKSLTALRKRLNIADPTANKTSPNITDPTASEGGSEIPVIWGVRHRCSQVAGFQPTDRAGPTGGAATEKQL